MQRIVWFVLWSVLWISNVQAVTYYVDQSIGSDSYTGLSQTVSPPNGPFATTGQCYARLITNNAPGDRCQVKNGTYTGFISPGAGHILQGTASAPIIFENYPGHTPILTSAVWLEQANTCGPSCRLSWFIFRGFEITGENSVNAIVFNNADNVTLENLYVHDNGNFVAGDGSGGNGLLATGIDIIVRNSIFARNGNTSGGGAAGHGLYITGSRWKVYNNLFVGNKAVGVQMKGGPTPSHVPSAEYAYFQNGIIVNNTFAYQGRSGMSFFVDAGGGGRVLNNQIINNIFYEERKATSSGPHVSIGTSVTGFIFRSNIAYDASASGKDFIGNYAALCSGCTLSLNCPASASGTGICGTAPTFVNAPATEVVPPDLHLLPTSPVGIDQGFDVSAFGINTDYDGNVRPGNGVYDIGAYEINAGDITPPAPPTNLRITRLLGHHASKGTL